MRTYGLTTTSSQRLHLFYIKSAKTFFFALCQIIATEFPVATLTLR